MAHIQGALGPVVPRGDFQDAVRIRLGAPLAKPGTPCARCGFAMEANTCKHGLLCALPEATKGHYECRDCVLELAHLADPRAEAETRGLIDSSPSLRPADVLSAAVFPGRLAALDVGVTSPDRSGLGDDCCESMNQWRRMGLPPAPQRVGDRSADSVQASDLVDLGQVPQRGEVFCAMSVSRQRDGTD